MPYTDKRELEAISRHLDGRVVITADRTAVYDRYGRRRVTLVDHTEDAEDRYREPEWLHIARLIHKHESDAIRIAEIMRGTFGRDVSVEAIERWIFAPEQRAA